MEHASSLSIKELKNTLSQRGIDYSDCIEKSDLIKKYIDSTPKPGSISVKSGTIGSLFCTELNLIGDINAPKVGIILMHGYGANRNDLFPLLNEILKKFSMDIKPSICCFIPDAPLSLDGGSSKAWFPLDFIQLISTPPMKLAESTLPGLDDASTKVQQLVKEFENRGYNNIILSGFSQGAILSAYTAFALTNPSIIKGLCLFSTAVQAKNHWIEASKKFKHCKVILSHGKSDPVIPFAMGQLMNTILSDSGINVDWCPFEGGHTIPPILYNKYENLIKEVVKSADNI